LGVFYTLGGVLASVDLDYSIFFKTHKIDDIDSDGLLPSKLDRNSELSRSGIIAPATQGLPIFLNFDYGLYLKADSTPARIKKGTARLAGRPRCCSE